MQTAQQHLWQHNQPSFSGMISLCLESFESDYRPIDNGLFGGGSKET